MPVAPFPLEKRSTFTRYEALLPLVAAVGLALPTSCACDRPGRHTTAAAEAPAAEPGAERADTSGEPDPAPGSADDVPSPPAERPAEVRSERLDTLSSYFRSTELRGAVDDYLQGRNMQAARTFGAFAEEHDGSEEGRAARFMALLSKHDAGRYEAVAGELEALAESWPTLADYALYYAASAHLGAERTERALEALERLPEPTTLTLRAMELRGKALLQAERPADAAAALEEALETRPDGRAELWRLLIRAHEARDRKDEAKAARREVASRFPARSIGRAARDELGDPPGFSAEQWQRRGEHLHDGHHHAEAVGAFEEAIASYGEGRAEACRTRAQLARTRERMKDHDGAWSHWKEVLEGCDDEQALARATFSGGRNRFWEDEHEDARRILQRHVDDFHDETTADDAALMIAKSWREQAEEDDDLARREAWKRADGMLLEQLRRWPDGDMAEEAGWTLLQPRVEAARWGEVRRMSDRILDRGVRGTDYHSWGRIPYWKGVALARLGDVEAATGIWERVLVEHALTWYALMAHRRLQRRDPVAAEEALQRAREASNPATDPLRHVPERMGEDPHFRKALALARLGIGDSVARELAAAPGRPDETEAARHWSWTRIALYELAGDHRRAVAAVREHADELAANWPVGHHRRLWELAHPRPYEELVRRWAEEHGVEPAWIWGVMREESGFDATVESWAHAHGLMQLIPPTARRLARGIAVTVTPQTLRQPKVSIRLGSKFLARLLERHPPIPLASAGYNAGGGAVARWRRRFGHLPLDAFVEAIPFRQTRDYAKRVTQATARYTWLYRHRALPELPLDPPGAP